MARDIPLDVEVGVRLGEMRFGGSTVSSTGLAGRSRRWRAPTADGIGDGSLSGPVRIPGRLIMPAADTFDRILEAFVVGVAAYPVFGYAPAHYTAVRVKMALHGIVVQEETTPYVESWTYTYDYDQEWVFPIVRLRDYFPAAERSLGRGWQVAESSLSGQKVKGLLGGIGYGNASALGMSTYTPFGCSAVAVGANTAWESSYGDGGSGVDPTKPRWNISLNKGVATGSVVIGTVRYQRPGDGIDETTDLDIASGDNYFPFAASLWWRAPTILSAPPAAGANLRSATTVPTGLVPPRLDGVSSSEPIVIEAAEPSADYRGAYYVRATRGPAVVELWLE